MRYRLAFFAIVWAYVALAALYAVNTPNWQAPDEPAHYNYVRTIAEQKTLPVLQFGDYDQTYLESIKAQKFPASLPIDTIRYESHQPPTYYLLAAPFYTVAESASLTVRLIGLRLDSLLWGAVLLALVYRITQTICPSDPWLPLLACALVAFVPQHLAMEAALNNDGLAEVVLAAAVLGMVRVLQQPGDGRRQWLTIGGLVGLGFVTKTTTYISVGLVALTALILWRKTRTGFSNGLLALTFALLIALPWFARDVLTYGPTDILGLQRHNAIVVGQPRTLDLYGNYINAAAYFFPITFRSFWGQFGWMGVVLDARLYDALLVFSVFALAGLLTVKAPFTIRPAYLMILSGWFAFMFIAMLSYNLEFFQAQGRYLFPALGAIAILLALGLRGWIRLAARWSVPHRITAGTMEWAWFGVVTVGFITLDSWCLYRAIIPQLR